mgnify:CR=1 FL=1
MGARSRPITLTTAAGNRIGIALTVPSKISVKRLISIDGSTARGESGAAVFWRIVSMPGAVNAATGVATSSRSVADEEVGISESLVDNPPSDGNAAP